VLSWGILLQSAQVEAKWDLFGGVPPRKTPGSTLDHGLVSLIGWGFSDLRKLWGKVEPSEGKEVFFWKILVSSFSKEVKFSLIWGKQREQILFEKLIVFDADEQVQKECNGCGSPTRRDIENSADGWAFHCSGRAWSVPGCSQVMPRAVGAVKRAQGTHPVAGITRYPLASLCPGSPWQLLAPEYSSPCPEDLSIRKDSRFLSTTEKRESTGQ
jgi:hypothetical protein